MAFSSRGGIPRALYDNNNNAAANWPSSFLPSTSATQQHHQHTHSNVHNPMVAGMHSSAAQRPLMPMRRVARPFVDVLEIPDLLEAIDFASRQLRNGLERAMNSTLCDEQGNILEPKSSAALQNTTTGKPVSKSSAPKKPHDIYSFITEQSNKATAEKMAALRQARQRAQDLPLAKSNSSLPIVDLDGGNAISTNTAVVSPIKVKAPRSQPLAAAPKPLSPPRRLSTAASAVNNSNANRSDLQAVTDLTSVPIPKRKSAPIRSSWNSAAKGGPSILAKRPRTGMPPENESASKRKPITSYSSSGTLLPTPPTMASIAHIAANTKAAPRKATLAEIAAKEGRTTSNLTSSSKISALRSKEARGKAIDTSNYAHTRKSVHTKDQVAKGQAARLNNNNNNMAAQISKRAPKALPALAPLNSKSTAISSKVANAASRTAARANINNSFMNSNSINSPPSPFPAADLRRRPGLLPLVPSLQRNNSNRNSNSGNSGIENRIMFVRGMMAIGTVKPNGYTCGADGVTLRPRVSFDPKPKVPYKLRQTTAEKLFSAWKDIQKMPPMEALVKCLKTEQTMYAAAAGKIDYRAAALATLSTAKKAPDNTNNTNNNTS